MSAYATLSQARNERKAKETDANEDARLFEYLMAITGRIDERFNFRFEPVLETRNQDYAQVDRYSGLLTLDRPLMTAQTIVDSDGTELVLWDGTAAGRMAANVAAEPRNDTPIRALKKLNGQYWMSPIGDSGEGIYQVTGLWGYRRRYADGWKRSLDALTANAASGATLLHVGDPTAADITGRSPRFSPGQLIKIDDEFFNVTATTPDDTDATIAVEPAANGTEPAAHDTGATIYTWYPEPSIMRATLRWANYLYSRRGVFEQVTIDGFGSTVKYPGDMPEEVQNILDEIPMYRLMRAV